MNQGYPYKYEDLMEEPDITERIDNQNIMLEVKLRANFNVGYWEVQFFHTAALGQVPEKMKK